MPIDSRSSSPGQVKSKINRFDFQWFGGVGGIEQSRE
jgi:hypothetical protein